MESDDFNGVDGWDESDGHSVESALDELYDVEAEDKEHGKPRKGMPSKPEPAADRDGQDGEGADN